ncbi:MAG TPA: DUF3048 domain-containing protein [Acidimicrobiales bacterium]|nr:DUF3048 domain-containing protein [Acidimicrobiales bacterium]
MTSRHRLFGFAAALAALALVAAACSSGGGKNASAGSTAPATTTTTVPPVFPLTGLPAGADPKQSRPALVVKIENVAEARPQSGLVEADVVYEEIVEAGLSRLIVVYQSKDADPVGPVRSIRPSDPAIVKPLNPLYAYSGGTAKFINMLHAAGITDVGVDAAPKAYYRRPGRAAPHNLYSSTPRLYAQAPAGMAPPPKIFDFLANGEPFGGAGVLPASHLTVVPGVRTTSTYDYDPATNTWKRGSNGTPQVVEGGAQVAPTNVIVWFVPYVNSPGDVDVVGEPVSVAQVTGTGQAWVLSQGKVVKGSWSKPSAETPVSFTDAAGAPIKITPGTTWVEVQPVGTAATVQ